MTRDSGTEYVSPAAFRAALTARLKNIAASSRWQLPQLQRQVAYDRLLVRLYLQDRGWIVKGAIALLARDLGVRAIVRAFADPLLDGSATGSWRAADLTWRD